MAANARTRNGRRRPAGQETRSSGGGRRPEPAASAGAIVERDDHLVGADEAELAPDHLVGEVGIGVARIEQSRAVGEPRPLGLELGELDASARP